MISCLVVDDNKMARMALVQMAGQVSDLYVAGECETALDAYNFLQNQSVDLLFLDIEMPGLSGLELARQLRDKKTRIIYTTGKKEYAVDAFDLNVVDYLIKPVPLARFLEAIEKARKVVPSIEPAGKAGNADLLFVRDKGGLKKILINDILFFEAMGDYVKIHLREKYYTLHSTLKQLEQKLNPEQFLRVHRSYIIAMNKIDRIEDGVILMEQHQVPVADAYRNQLQRRIRAF